MNENDHELGKLLMLIVFGGVATFLALISSILPPIVMGIVGTFGIVIVVLYVVYCFRND